MDSSSETFRAGVGLLVLDDQGLVLAFERADIPGAWQLPQGGLQRGESTEHAAWRELGEETGLTRQHVTLEAVSSSWIGYELPAAYRKNKTGRGQVHLWHLFRQRPGTRLPSIPKGPGDEFSRARWMSLSELVDVVPPFRKSVYEALLRLIGIWHSPE